MTVSEFLKKYDILIALIIVGVLFVFGTCLFVETVTAAETFYFLNITPPNDLFELTVYPRDTLLQNRAYDFSKIYGVSGTFAHWDDETIEFTNCEPDTINYISYVKTNGSVNPRNVYLDPKEWPLGNWYQWDGCFNRYVRGQTTPNYVPYENDNALMFKIISYERDLPIIRTWQARQLQNHTMTIIDLPLIGNTT